MTIHNTGPVSTVMSTDDKGKTGGDSVPPRPGQWRLFAVWALIFGIGIGFFAGYVVGVEVGKDSITLLESES